MAVENKGEETVVADTVDVLRTSVISWRLVVGRNWELGVFCVVGEVDKRTGVVWHVNSEGSCRCWAERSGWDSCTGVERSCSGSVEAQGREQEEEEEETGDAEKQSGFREYGMVLWVISMLLSLMSTVSPL